MCSERDGSCSSLFAVWCGVGAGKCRSIVITNTDLYLAPSLVDPRYKSRLHVGERRNHQARSARAA